jgi:N-acetylglucosamine-6-sulfatase
VLSNQAPHGGFEAFDPSQALPVWLQAAGFETAHVGKYLNKYGETPGNAPIPPGWDRWETLILDSGHQYFGFKLNDDGTIVPHPTAPSRYLTDVLTMKAVAFVKSHQGGPRPWALFLDHLAPHGSNPLPAPAPRHLGTMGGLPLPPKPSFDEADVSDKPAVIRAKPPLSPNQIALQRMYHQRRLEALLAVDEGVARILDVLEHTGQLERTYVVFTSDNGFHLGEHRIASWKEHPYEEATRVPLAIRGPGIREGATIGALTSNVDLAPTIAQWCGATPSAPVDGRSLAPLLDGSATGWRRELLLENPLQLEYRALRTLEPDGREYLYVEYDHGQDGTVDERELYNLSPDACHAAPDPFQLESRHADPCYASLIERYTLRLAALGACSGASCP